MREKKKLELELVSKDLGRLWDFRWSSKEAICGREATRPCF
jgi:hypothetical protein